MSSFQAQGFVFLVAICCLFLTKYCLGLFDGCFEPVLNGNDKLRRNLAHKTEFKIKTVM
ncbi:purinergic receptor P2Y, G-protein coupled 1, isoform CRA_b [Rattus norvegicus]|uniref:Purinergic receptor P2Y, G-protein coupled 1, isoform CRA_b n=1 Tax=Rattus norvegicus TaxID=10116 RepID=A6JVM3_RAT|nr:purinergic receptor P2Y, G-protein coupled 1, isoform CRA_b [Rattus norvegicus]